MITTEIFGFICHGSTEIDLEFIAKLCPILTVLILKISIYFLKTQFLKIGAGM